MRRVNQYERTDRDITNALLKLMEHRTFEKITVQDILEEALINRSTFYQHFPDKYAILERLQEKLTKGMTERIEQARKGSWALPEINRVMCEYFAENREQMRRLLSVRSEGLDMEGQMRKLVGEYLRQPGNELTELEADILAGMVVRFFIHFLQGETDGAEFSSLMLNTWLDMTLYVFRMDQAPNAKGRLLQLVGVLHQENR